MVKPKTAIAFYGGVDEIGGNKILVQDRETKVLLDFGMSYIARKRYYSPPFLSPRSEKSLRELGILPEIDGVYRSNGTPCGIEAVFVSHAHMDHSAYLSFIKREIPVYCGETTKIILQALSEMRRADLEFNVEGIDFKTFRTGTKIRIGEIEVEPFHVDHSVPGAYGFVIYTSSGAVAYTGDFRDHGVRKEMTRDFVEKVRAAEPAAVITEATNMTGATVSSEREVESKLNNIVRQASGIVLAEFSSTDVDRLNSFYNAAKKSGRCLAVSLRQAYLMEALQRDKGLRIPKLDAENVLIFRKSKRKYEKWESQMVRKYENKIVDVFEASKRTLQCKAILATSLYDMEELVEIKPAAGSCYILSASEPFNEEMEMDFERLLNWLRHYGLPQYHAHVSGHIAPLKLKKALEKMNASKIFPIHTQDSELFAKFMRDLKGETIIVERGELYEI